MYRTKKYQERGYKLPGSTIAHIGLSIMRLEIQNYGDLKEQLRGIDTQFLDKFLSDDRRDEALPVSYGEIIDEIFEAMGLENL
jgi:hypothetical protein